MFSSVAALFGNAGQVNYAAANAALDYAACKRQSTGASGRVVSVQWGAWAGSGMASQDPGVVSRLEQLGLHAIHAAEGLRALARALSCSSCAGGVVCDLVRLLLAAPAVVGVGGYHTRQPRAAGRAGAALWRLGDGRPQPAP